MPAAHNCVTGYFIIHVSHSICMYCTVSVLYACINYKLWPYQEYINRFTALHNHGSDGILLVSV